MIFMAKNSEMLSVANKMPTMVEPNHKQPFKFQNTLPLYQSVVGKKSTLRMLERFQKLFQPKHTLRPSGQRRKFENAVRSIRVPPWDWTWNDLDLLPGFGFSSCCKM